MEIGY